MIDEAKWRIICKILEIEKVEETIQMAKTDPLKAFMFIKTRHEAILREKAKQSKAFQQNTRTQKIIWQDFKELREYCNKLNEVPEVMATAIEDSTLAESTVAVMADSAQVSNCCADAFSDLIEEHMSMKLEGVSEIEKKKEEVSKQGIEVVESREKVKKMKQQISSLIPSMENFISEWKKVDEEDRIFDKAEKMVKQEREVKEITKPKESEKPKTVYGITPVESAEVESEETTIDIDEEKTDETIAFADKK